MGEGEPRRSGRPFWQILAALYGSIVVLAATVMILAFGVASLVTGAAY